jgi:hypothetical protein
MDFIYDPVSESDITFMTAREIDQLVELLDQVVVYSQGK